MHPDMFSSLQSAGAAWDPYRSVCRSRREACAGTDVIWG